MKVAEIDPQFLKYKIGFIDFFYFGFKEVRACIFAGSFFGLLFLSKHIPLLGMYRYDFLFVTALVIQVVLIALKIETWDEVKAISLFHVLGFTLEAFKTHPSIGSWSYPEPGYIKLFNVPLYSGFMYAAVASYIIQAWRILKIEVVDHPPVWIVWILAFAIYANFFTHHFIGDFRWFLVFLVSWAFRKTDIFFTPNKIAYKMPLLIGFILTGFFIWLAENMATFLGAWTYPNQKSIWSVVHIGKWSSWSLLVIMTFIIVTNLKSVTFRNLPFFTKNKKNSI